MKTFLIKYVLSHVIDLAIEALQRLAHKSDNSVDDLALGIIVANRDKLIDEIKSNL